MSFTISAILLFGLLLAMLVRSKAVGAGSAIVAVLFGYYLSRTPAAAAIDQVMSSLAHAIPNITN
ncbi:hypothetical protein ACTPOK_20070 [Streptomyces inhibens]|uniref:hypothetical protein n=1 Tax=Streptomyces inhibens TaxID=2293571 RepID=UPI00402A9D31